MSDERDPTKLADEMDEQAQEMQERSDELGSDVADARADWKQKQGAADVPGANPPDLHEDSDSESAEQEASHEGSPSPEAPPEEESPSSAEMASEGAAGPPADSDRD